MYHCVEPNSSVNIEWIVEDFFVNAGFRNLHIEVGQVIPSRDGQFEIAQVSVDPLTTTMAIPGSFNKTLTINCSGSNLAMSRYLPGSKYFFLKCNHHHTYKVFHDITRSGETPTRGVPLRYNTKIALTL